MKASKIILSNKQKILLKSYSHENEPKEACCFLLGEVIDKIVTVFEIKFVKNISTKITDFEISNKVLLEVVDYAKKKNLWIVGIFHSHLDSPATPSVLDKCGMKGNAIVWMIYSRGFNEIRAFIFDEFFLSTKEIPILARV